MFMPAGQFYPWYRLLQNNASQTGMLGRTRQMSRLVHKLRPGGRRAAQPSSPIVLFGFNSGYAYLFENWALGCAANGIEMRDRTIVVSDEASRVVVERHGYAMPAEKVYGLDVLCDGKAGARPKPGAKAAARMVCESAAKKFALWPHQAWMAAWIVAAHDLVLLGHDVLMLDVDIAWQRDPLPWLTAAHPYMPCSAAPRSIWEGSRPNNLDTYGYKWQCPVSQDVAEPTKLDLQLMEDGRTDSHGPGNGGLLMIRSNCRTRRFMRAWFSALPVMVNERSGQLLINRLLMSPSLNVSMGLLPPQLFLNGPHLVGRGYLMGRSPAVFPRDWMVAHVSWTGSHLEKLGCFWLLGAAHLPADRWPNGSMVNMSKKEVLFDAKTLNRTRRPPAIGVLNWKDDPDPRYGAKAKAARAAAKGAARPQHHGQHRLARRNTISQPRSVLRTPAHKKLAA
jgi:hypothetical protein